MPSLNMAYNPRLWNGEDIRRQFNCYAYALNTKKEGWASLHGSLSNNRKAWEFLTASCAGLDMAKESQASAIVWLMLDGLEPIRKHQYAPDEAHIIAYDVEDLHFYRLDGNKEWSHKPGANYATNRDERGKAILDLETAKLKGRIPRPDELLYFRIPEEGMMLRPRDLDAHPVFGEIARACPAPPDTDGEHAWAVHEEQRAAWERTRNRMLTQLVPARV